RPWPRSAGPRHCPRSSVAPSAFETRRSSHSRSGSLRIAFVPSAPRRVAELASLTESEFRRLCEFLYRRTGMLFTETKRYYVERRVVDRMQATAADSFEAYFARLRSGAGAEIERLVNAFTVNETYFYREEHQ